mgnify:CR=1 FL=1
MVKLKPLWAFANWLLETPRSKRIKKILNFFRDNNVNPKEVNKYPRFIKVDNQLAYVFGWYIAEGSTGDGFIRFALNKNEINYAKEIDKIISRKFGIKGSISIEDNRLVIIFCGKILEILFSKLCGKGAENKRIPFEFFNQKLLPHLLKGLFLGDGHFNKSGWSLTTASRQLANDTILALLKLKKKFNFHKSKREIYKICYQPNNPNISHSNKSWFIEDKYLCFMIHSIKKEKYSGLVYNLEIEKDNSYTTSAFSVHNCLFEALASGLPIVASPVNGIPYEMSEKNGIFVDYGNIAGLKQSILKILSNPKLTRKYALNNKKTALKYNWDLIYKKTSKLYNDVLATN